MWAWTSHVYRLEKQLLLITISSETLGSDHWPLLWSLAKVWLDIIDVSHTWILYYYLYYEFTDLHEDRHIGEHSLKICDFVVPQNIGVKRACKMRKQNVSTIFISKDDQGNSWKIMDISDCRLIMPSLPLIQNTFLLNLAFRLALPWSTLIQDQLSV